MDVLILGCGFTGRRLARRLVARGLRVLATSRKPEDLGGLGVEAVRLEELRIEPGMRVVHSIPPDGSAGLIERLGDAPVRVIYLSTTAVYGEAREVNASTPVDPSTERARTRLEEEARVAAGTWSSLILRPAGIYGPGRSVLDQYLRGVYQPTDNFVSRIHVDDLAAHIEAGLFSQVTGAWPVADEEPCTSREMAAFCAQLLGVARPEGDGKVRRPSANRKVDGSAIRRELGIELQYPSYREGIQACIRAKVEG